MPAGIFCWDYSFWLLRVKFQTALRRKWKLNDSSSSPSFDIEHKSVLESTSSLTHRAAKQRQNGQNLSSCGTWIYGREENHWLVQHRRADEEHDGEAAEGEDIGEDSGACRCGRLVLSFCCVCFVRNTMMGLKFFYWFQFFLWLYRWGKNEVDLRRQDAGRGFWPAVHVWNPALVYYPDGDQSPWRWNSWRRQTPRGDHSQPFCGSAINTLKDFLLQLSCNLPVQKNKIILSSHSFMSHCYTIRLTF